MTVESRTAQSLSNGDESDFAKRADELLQRFFENTIAHEEAEELLDLWNRFPELNETARMHFEVEQLLQLRNDLYRTPTSEQQKRLKELCESVKETEHCGNVSLHRRNSIFFSHRNRFLSVAGGATVLSCVFLGMTLFFLWNQFRGENAVRSAVSPIDVPSGSSESQVLFGKVVENSRKGVCQWGEDSTALRKGNQIGPGQIRLLRGIAQIYFDNGATLTLEAPAHLTLYSNTHCYLHSGRVSAKILPEAVGFTIETSVADIKDIGTEFGVSIQEDKEADVHVFSGRVDVQPKNKQDIIPVTTGGWLRFDDAASPPYTPHSELFEERTRPSSTDLPSFVCTTKEGRGQEAWVISGGDPSKMDLRMKSRSEYFTLIKNSHQFADPWHRKGYFSIDLSPLPDDAFSDVQLEMAFAPTGVGVTSYAPAVSTFTVYGLMEEALDEWKEEALAWNNAPANAPGGDGVDTEKVMKIASFEITREEEACRRIISNESLRQFLASDTNRLVTFIVVRNTPEEDVMGYAHGIANRRHPKLPPPTLRFFR